MTYFSLARNAVNLVSVYQLILFQLTPFVSVSFVTLFMLCMYVLLGLKKHFAFFKYEQYCNSCSKLH